jgi:hypothetical protein
MKKTVLILGAGASVDYGYPTWVQLRQQMLELDIEHFLASEVKINYRGDTGLNPTDIAAHKEAHDEFCRFTKSNPDSTLDQIIYRIDQPKEKHLNPSGNLLINIAGLLLAKVELEKKDAGWVTNFQEVLVEYLVAKMDPSRPDQNLLRNLSVISLNYDRVFKHFIAHDFYKKIVDRPSYNLPSAGSAITFSRNNRIKVFNPHGYICRLNNQNSSSRVGMNRDLAVDDGNFQGTRYPGNDSLIAYGDPRIAGKDSFLRMGRYMYVVDERGADDYRESNEVLRRAEVVICLGLSHAGISQSSFDFANVKTIYLSNKESDIAAISRQTPGPKYVSLGVGGARLDASDFPDRFKRLCF